MIGFFLLLFFSALLVIFILRVGFSLCRLLLDAVGVLVGGVVVGLPGACLCIGGIVTAATGGGGSLMTVGAVLGVTGVFFGGFAGLALVERLRQKVQFSWKALGFEMLGSGVSTAFCFLCILSAQNDPVFEVPFLILTIPSVDLGFVAGYALLRSRLKCTM